MITNLLLLAIAGLIAWLCLIGHRITELLADAEYDPAHERCLPTGQRP